MVMSDDFGLEDDDTSFLEAATQVETAQNGGRGFAPSSRPAKRRRVDPGGSQIDGADSEEERAYQPTRNSKQGGPRPRTIQYGPNARRRASSDSEDGDDPGYYFPGELGEKNTTKNSKRLIHIPKNVQPFEDSYLSQTQADLNSSPDQIRGAIWKKIPDKPSPRSKNGTESPRNSDMRISLPTIERRPLRPIQSATALLNAATRSETGANHSFEKDAALAARLQAEEDNLARQKPKLGLHKPVNMIEELADLPSDAFSSSATEQPAARPILISSQHSSSIVPRQVLRGPQTGLKQMTIFGGAATQPLTMSQAAKKKHSYVVAAKEEKPTHHKLNEANMATWVYPTNLGTIRDYQFNIVSRSLFHNTLVALPTGLGKTFIAATVMLNYYRWTVDAQIVFMAPTKPLIAQQMEACFQTVGIPRRDTIVMTGETTPGARADEWSEKRMFFMTPQTVINDLKTGICDPKRIVCVVVDEAHKATGAYAYTEVIAFLRRFNPSFRVLALTATPGGKVESVQGVIDNLSIARVELRTEDSIDIRQYTHEKLTETELFDFSDEQSLIMEHLSKAIKPVLERLNQQNASWIRDPMHLTAYGLQIARAKWQASEPGRRATMPVKGMVNGIITCLSQIAHGIGLLKFHGINPFYNYALEFQRNVENGQSKGKYPKQIIEHEGWVKMMGFIRGWIQNPDFIGHPKLEYLREVVLNHFLDAGEGGQRPGATVSPTRIMVFASYRDSTEDIVRVLKRNEPMIRPHAFVGQQASKDSEGMNQKRQNEVIQEFKAGKYNTLVATSIGEEGLDIGDVDLIVCYDASASPIRMLQRIGRTGRKRVGRVCLLLMKTKEVDDYAKAKDNYAWIQRSIADPSKYNYHDDRSPRVLPATSKPEVDKRVIDIPIENTQPVDLNEKGRRGKGKGRQKRPPKKFHMPDGVQTGFVNASRLDSDNEEDAQTNTIARSKSVRKTVTKSTKAKAEPVPEPVQVPFLGDVVLNQAQQKDLERRYARTADRDEDNTISAPDPSRFPEAMLNPGRIRYMHHGRAAKSTARALQAVQSVNDDTLERWKGFLHQEDLQYDDESRARLVSPPLAHSIADTESPDLPHPTSKSKKPQGRPRQKKAIQRATSYGSAAAEGDESEPEPTPADMRIGTQGIDLGSNDTSGEDDAEEHDSELDDFVVRSDQPIEMASSSQSGTQQVTRRKRGLKKKSHVNTLEILSEEESDDVDFAGDEFDRSESEDDVFEVGRKGRKKRVVNDSDGDE
ncbi:P-loop containing nucleoside triphosphate hydrolase protein [Polychaeton citri CBS 116435]|uniref:ATP-dependent DNA helicase n=1 Tax=Polychaeton citri CBS 116435 TaxID=1314669 RepID=A0A9P4UL38_9PEZI|nr:P-loop containing nucleoside triphosphate hydrolase protein [Polychaeton citri CBS 116435]